MNILVQFKMKMTVVFARRLHRSSSQVIRAENVARRPLESFVRTEFLEGSQQIFILQGSNNKNKPWILKYHF